MLQQAEFDALSEESRQALKEIFGDRLDSVLKVTKQVPTPVEVQVALNELSEEVRYVRLCRARAPLSPACAGVVVSTGLVRGYRSA